ncbi:MAG TPA: hypothetical protein VFM51_07895 [Solirubrobacterales bacterium]|nr:hypothetical protein [Solirubrobacterales bacterium]
MKARGSLVALLFALTAALALPGGAAGKPAELKLSSFKIQGSNGYDFEVVAIRDGLRNRIAVVSVASGSTAASYRVPLDPESGIHATFGLLGHLDVRFERRRKLVERPEPGCRWVFEGGVFRGSFQFVGEGGYTSGEAIDPQGEVLRLPNSFCGFGNFRLARIPIPGLSETVLAARAENDDRTTSFEASRFNRERTALFSASLSERVGEMKIERSAYARGGAETFFRTNSSRASVFPPSPFRGSAKFRDPAQAPPTWTGSLSVSFPGAPDVPLAGEAFWAKLCPRLYILSRCLKGRSARSSANAARLYGSGSHSHPLALAKLSSLR